MTSGSIRGKRLMLALGTTAVAAVVLAGCSSANGGDSGGGSDALIVGTTDKVTALDPAGSYDNGSFVIQNQIYPFLLNSKPGSSDVVPDIATSAEFTTPTEYTVKLKDGLTFANGDKLTSSDVKFSFDRQLKIADENGPSVLLYNLDTIDTPDDTTVVFNLKAGNDQVWPQILSSPAGLIVDEEVFSADALTSDADVVKGKGFAGQYSLDKYDVNSLASFSAFDGYDGVLGKPKTSDMTMKYYADASNLKLDVQENNIDVAYRSLSATDTDDLSKNDKVKVITGPGGEIRYITFNLNTQPYGATTPEADPAKALAVRQAVADLVDRDAIATQVYKGTYTPLYSYVPAGLTGSTEALKDLYGKDGAPDPDAAAAALSDAGVTTPVVLNLQYNPDHYGGSSGDEYALVKSQLEKTGLFTVNLQSTEWVQYSKDRVADVYPVFQMGWFPDYPDADNYLSPFFTANSFLVNHYENTEVFDLIAKQATELDPAARTAEIEDIQSKVAADLPTVPLLQGAQVAVVATGVDGLVLDGSFKFRFGTISKG